ncbi:MAG: hemolysin family protein [Candidatus Aminicenantales bacterium]|jgi:putative hemolysin
MFLPALILFVLCLIASAFFSSSETAFIASSRYSLEHAEKQGSKRAGLVRRILHRTNEFLATILIGNTLVNVAAASIATSVFVTLVPDRSRAILLATVTTTLFLLIFAEINPKTFAAHNPLRTALFFSYPVRGMMVIFFPFVKLLSFITGLLVPSSRGRRDGPAGRLSEEEIRILVLSGTRGLSALRRKMISGALDINARPVKEIMVPRPEVKAVEIDWPWSRVLETVRSAGHSRYPVYKGRFDNIEGTIHTKDIIRYLIDNKDINVRSILRPPLFVPELASLEKVLLQMQERAVHMAFVVDEYGNMEGIVTLEDIIEEVVGDFRDEHDGTAEECFARIDDGAYLIKGSAPVKEANARLSLGLPERKDYTTLAGFLLYEFGRIPAEKDSLEFGGSRLTVEKMNKRHISLIRVDLGPAKGPSVP